VAEFGKEGGRRWNLVPPRNIMRRPLDLPPMERIKADDPPSETNGYGRLAMAVAAVREEQREEIATPIETTETLPFDDGSFCMNCGTGPLPHAITCPDCGGDVYEPSEP